MRPVGRLYVTRIPLAIMRIDLGQYLRAMRIPIPILGLQSRVRRNARQLSCMAENLLDSADSHVDYSRVNFRGSWRAATVAVVGLGALGSEVVRLLGSMGAGRVLLIDPDTIEPVNLPFSVLFRMAFASQAGPDQSGRDQSGWPKAATLARIGGLVFPGTCWEPFGEEVADVPLQRLAACELIFSCTDNALARAETSLLARLLGKPMIDGGLKSAHTPSGATTAPNTASAPEGRVSHFDPAAGAACYLCQLSEQRRAELLRWALAVTPGCAAQPEAAAMQGTPALASVVAGTMVEVALASLPEGPAGAQAAAPARSRSWICRVPPGSQLPVEIELSRSADCPWHQAPYAATPYAATQGAAQSGALHAIDFHASLATTLQAISAARGDRRPTVLELLWPLCLEARCAACGAATRPLQRVARVRRRGRCPACGAGGTLEPLVSVGSIAEHDALATRSPAQLGLPERHLFWCRAQYPSEPDRTSGSAQPTQTELNDGLNDRNRRTDKRNHEQEA